MSYTIAEIKVAAFNWTELPDMDIEERALWESLGYWYEQYRANPDSRKECEDAANGYIDLFLRIQLQKERNK